jgi:hypothetical protein
MVALTCNSNNKEAEARGSGVQGHSGIQSKTLSPKPGKSLNVIKTLSNYIIYYQQGLQT